MKKYPGLLLFIFFYSCASLHTPSPHFVPSITKEKQFEGEASLGFRSVSVNFAYSLLHRLTLMGNVQALPFKSATSHFQRNCEMAVGTYGSRKIILFGMNAGYGLGAYNWDYYQFNDSAAYTLRTNGNFQKVMLQFFFAFTDDASNPGWLAGISLKENFYWDQYASLRYTTHENENFSGIEKNTSFEPCFFMRSFFTQKFYLNIQAGMNICYDHSMFWPGQYLFVRAGIGIRL